MAGVAKVIGVSKLKGKYEPFEAKRQLCNSYDLFLADDRVVPSLPKLIGDCFSHAHLFAPLCISLLLTSLGHDWDAEHPHMQNVDLHCRKPLLP